MLHYISLHSSTFSHIATSHEAPYLPVLNYLFFSVKHGGWMGLEDYFPAGHGHFGVPCSFLRSGTQTWLEAGPFTR